MRDSSSTSRRVIIRDVPGNGRGKGEAVSYALWDFFIGKGREGKGQNDGGRGGEGACHESWPPDANQEALGALVEMGKRKREGIMANNNYACKSVWSLSYLMYIPEDSSVSSFIAVSSLVIFIGPRLAYFRYAIRILLSSKP